MDTMFALQITKLERDDDAWMCEICCPFLEAGEASPQQYN